MRKPKETPKVTVKVKKVYLDLQLNKIMTFGETFEVDLKRAEELSGLELVDILG